MLCKKANRTNSAFRAPGAPRHCLLKGLPALLLVVPFLGRPAVVRADEVRTVEQPVICVDESFAESQARTPHKWKLIPAPSVQPGSTILAPGAPLTNETGPGAFNTGIGVLKSLPVPPAPLLGPQSPQPRGTLNVTSFPGPVQTTGAIRPDPHLAVSESYVVTCTSEGITVRTKDSNVRFSQDWGQFFASVDPQGSIDSVFYPKVLYDRGSQRFFLLLIGAGGGSGGGNFQSSSYLLAVTQTPDPTGIWRKFASESTLNQAWSTYPGLGNDETSIYVTANYLSTASNQFSFSALRVYPKFQFVQTNLPSTLNFTEIADVRAESENGPTRAQTLQPAVSFYNPGGNTTVEWFVSCQAGFSPERRIFLYNVAGGLTPRLINRTTINLPSDRAFSFPPFVEQPGGAFVNALDGRILSAFRVGSSLWACHGVSSSVSPNGEARWYEFDISNSNAPTLRQSGFVNFPSGIAAFMPAIVANTNGDAVMVFSRGGATEANSMWIAARLASDAPGTMPIQQVVTDGTSPFSNIAWGEYAGAALDPLDGLTAWVLHQTATSPTVWRTTIARIPFAAGGGGGTGACPDSLELVEPTRATTWVKGNARSIQWTGFNLAQDNAPITIELARFDPQTQSSRVIGFIRNAQGGVDFTAAAQQYSWTVGSALRSVSDPQQLVDVPSSGAVGDYQIIVRSAFCPEIFSASVEYFRIIDALTVDITASPAIITRGNSSTLTAAVAGGTPPYQFSWTPIESLDNATIFRPIATPAGGRRDICDPDLECVTYKVRVLDSTGPTAQVATDEIVVKIADPLSVDAGPSRVFAAGGTVLLEGRASGGGAPYTYLWNPIPDTTQPAGSNGANLPQPLARPNGDTIYTLTVTDRFGFVGSDTVSARQGFVANVSASPAGAGTITRDNVKPLYLPGDLINFTARPNTGFRFLRWEIGPPGTSNPSTPSDNPTGVAMPATDLNVVAVFGTDSGGQRPQDGTNNGGNNSNPGATLPVGCGVGTLMSTAAVFAMLAATRVRRRRR